MIAEARTPLWLKLLALAALVAGAVWLLAPLGGVLQVVVFGALLAYLLDPLVNRLEARGVGHGTATAVVFVGVLLAIGVPLVLLFPVLAAQLGELQAGFDAEVLSAGLETVEGWLAERLRPLGVEGFDLREQAAALASEHLTAAVGALPGVLGLVTQLVIVPFVAFLLLRDGRRFRKGLIALVPNRYFEFTLNVLHKADQQLGGYLRGQLLAAIIVGLLATLALWVIGVPYFFIIGAVAGVTNLIPFLGPAAGALTAVLVSVVTLGTFDQVLPIVVTFALIQVIDNTVSQPLLLSRNVELHPLAILLVLLVAAQLFGVVGLLLAVPVAAIAKVLVQEFVTTFRRYRFS